MLIKMSVRYGTSGFRYDNQTMIDMSENIGKAIATLAIQRFIDRLTLACCKSCATRDHYVLTGIWGIMITASHNPSHDNGIKIVDQSGSMPTEAEERLLTDVVNGNQINDSAHSIDSSHIRFVFARDTRESGLRIRDRIQIGIKNVLPEAQFIDVGYRTTPELHVLTMKYYSPITELIHNPELHANFTQVGDIEIYPDGRSSLTADTYYARYLKFLIRNYGIDLRDVVLDCANGVGAITMGEIVNEGNCPIMINTHTDIGSALNDRCGSDYVENNSDAHLISITDSEYFKELWYDSLESGIDAVTHIMRKNSRGERQGKQNNLDLDGNDRILSIESRLFASFDGDADRIVFYYLRPHNQRTLRPGINDLDIVVMNGDYIACLILEYVFESIRTDNHYEALESISIGIIHTAYSNGGFDDAISGYSDPKIRVENKIVSIGVKNLLRETPNYDVAIYFESNGHGSIMVNNHHGIQELIVLKRLFSQVIGDAIANLIGVKYILQRSHKTPSDMKALFKTRESRILKIPIDKNIKYDTNYDQTELREPKELASTYEKFIRDNLGIRTFVRPSGTEPILRAYVENDRRGTHDLDLLSRELTQIFAIRSNKQN